MHYKEELHSVLYFSRCQLLVWHCYPQDIAPITMNPTKSSHVALSSLHHCESFPRTNEPHPTLSEN
jgi:hypothetical protein